MSRAPSRPAARAGVPGPKAVRKRSRKASIGQTGAFDVGRRPGTQPQPAIRRITAGSWAITETGTSWLDPTVTGLWGWWSPSTTSTRFGSG